jgi:hypothetical protein
MLYSFRLLEEISFSGFTLIYRIESEPFPKGGLIPAR